MSPQQARGASADHQADIWAWGCVLYEMLAGRRAFPGSTRADVLAGVLEREPDWDALPSTTPLPVRKLLRRCLRKDGSRRLRDIGDARIELEDLLSAPAEASEAESRGRRAAAWIPAATASFAAALLIAFGLSRFTAGDRAQQTLVSRFVVAPPEGSRIPEWDSLAVSNDGSAIAFVAARSDETRRIYVRARDGFEARPLPGTEGGRAPFFSPAGDRLGFHGADGTIRTVAVAGGPVATLADAGAPVVRGSLWHEDGIVFPSGNIIGGLSRLRPGAADREALTAPAVERGEIAHAYPATLPFGRLLFSLWSDEGWNVAVLSLGSEARRVVIPGGRAATYLPDGLITYRAENALMVAPFDARSGTLTGAATPVIDDVAAYAVSRSGMLVYRPLTPGPTELVWLDRSGEQELVFPERGSFYAPTLSPDGRQLAVAFQWVGGASTFVLDLERGSRWHPSSEGSVNNFPTWSPDGSALAFNSLRRPAGIYRVSTDGAGAPELLLAREGSEPKLPGAWSPDGRHIIFEQATRDSRRDLWVLPLAEEAAPSRFVATSANEHSPSFSPEGRFVAYVSDESGRSEIYVRSFPGR